MENFTFPPFFPDDDDDNFPYAPFPNTIWYMKPKWEVITRVGVLAPVVICGVIGNLAVLNAVIQCKKLRTPTNLLISNMAVADLLQLTLCAWMSLTKDLYQFWMLGEFGCKFQGFLECLLLLTDVITLCSISYDRFTAIVMPCERLSLKKTHILMATSWMVGFLLAIPLLTGRIYKERKWLNVTEKYCTEEDEFLPVYWNVLLAFLVWLPLCIMFVCYATIFIKLDRYEQEILKREHPISVCYKTKVAKMVFIILITFIVCRLPLTAVIFIRQWVLKNNKNQVDGKLNLLNCLSNYLIYANAAVNPIIYGLKNDNFQKAFRTSKLSKWIFCSKSDKLTPMPQGIIVMDLNDKAKTNRFEVRWLEPVGSGPNDNTMQFYNVNEKL